MDFPEWYRLFQNVSLPSIVIDNVPENFLQYLRGNGSLKYFDEEDAKQNYGNFFDLVNAAIKSLGGTCFVKFSDAAPVDAKWIGVGKGLACYDANDVATLLKSSDRIQTRLLETVRPPCLILRQFKELHPAGEFRCFVREGKLKGISQRILLNCFPFLENDINTPNRIIEFVDKIVLAGGPFNDFSVAIDVYCDSEVDSLCIIDVSEWSGEIKPDFLLFSEDELITACTPLFRAVTDEQSVVTTAQLSIERWPSDFCVFGKEPLTVFNDLLLEVSRGDTERDL